MMSHKYEEYTPKQADSQCMTTDYELSRRWLWAWLFRSHKLLLRRVKCAAFFAEPCIICRTERHEVARNPKLRKPGSPEGDSS